MLHIVYTNPQEYIYRMNGKITTKMTMKYERYQKWEFLVIYGIYLETNVHPLTVTPSKGSAWNLWTKTRMEIVTSRLYRILTTLRQNGPHSGHVYEAVSYRSYRPIPQSFSLLEQVQISRSLGSLRSSLVRSKVSLSRTLRTNLGTSVVGIRVTPSRWLAEGPAPLWKGVIPFR